VIIHFLILNMSKQASKKREGWSLLLHRDMEIQHLAESTEQQWQITISHHLFHHSKGTSSDPPEDGPAAGHPAPLPHAKWTPWTSGHALYCMFCCEIRKSSTSVTNLDVRPSRNRSAVSESEFLNSSLRGISSGPTHFRQLKRPNRSIWVGLRTEKASRPASVRLGRAVHPAALPIFWAKRVRPIFWAALPFSGRSHWDK
jgi:hypothetical protein